MDPDVAYTRLFEAAARMGALLDLDTDGMGDQAREENARLMRDQGEEIRDHWEALDGWLKMGGHAPKAWDQRLRSR